jgi:nucleosome binding factor SPN SPT16 subunit
MADIKIDGKLFQERINHFINAWKADKRAAGDQIFGGVSSIIILMGKVEEDPEFHKNNAMHVRIPLGTCKQAGWNLLTQKV